VVDDGVIVDRSEPKNCHRLLNGETQLPPLLISISLCGQDLAVLYTLEHESRIQDVKFARRVDQEGEVILVAAEDKKTTVYEICLDSDTVLRPIAYLVGHRNRCVADTI
jgi:protein MAK11